MSSSSSATDDRGPVARLLAESLAALAAELPEAHARVSARLAGRPVAIRVDGERFAVEADGGAPQVRAAGAGEEVAAAVRVATSRRAILDVLDARRSLAEAVLADEVEVVGALERLVEAREALLAYVHGAVRSPSFPALLERFRRLAP
ncbi:hypothetical protein SOCE836_003690 [Sorangium cellulosum]|uniref:SCP2 domain-containing protein n=1 Tax=Sorangium cellulosum TaxID=56 RepID=A0A4P2QEW1_SORCE|nr:hypothetical protein SOCE836_003690 [Sorangium cellulosum]WCQ87693.1 hypothetical protein NQZ70_00356 [Sorangium sp. Soce836]